MTEDHKHPPSDKKGAAPLSKSPAKIRAERKRIEREAEQAAARAKAARLAQIVNLHIAGFSLDDIGASIGASAEEVDRILTQDTARYVKTQPALRNYVRNWLSEKWMKMIEADWDAATDPSDPKKLEHQDRVDRFLRSMGRLHGAEAPVQSEIKVETAPEAVEKLVSALAAGQGLDYDADIFDADVIDADVVHEASSASSTFLETASSDEEDDGDEL